MSRTVFEVKSSNNVENEKRIVSILTSNNYKRKEKNNEVYYKQGNSILVASKCIKYTISGDKIIFEAWVNNNGISESSLSGAMGALPKRQCKKILDLIVNSLEISNENEINEGSNENESIDSKSIKNVKDNFENVSDELNQSVDVNKSNVGNNIKDEVLEAKSVDDNASKSIKNVKDNFENVSDELNQSVDVNKSNVENNIKEEVLEAKSVDDNKNESTNSIYCSKCGTLNPENSRFCNSCGNDLNSFPQTKCPNCGTINPENSRFCNSCGENLAGQIFGISYQLFGYILKVIVFILGIVSISFSSEFVYTFEGAFSSLIYLIFAYILLLYMGYVTYKKLAPKIHIIILDILALISIFFSLCMFITEGIYLFNDLQLLLVIIGIPIILFALYIIGKELNKSKVDKTSSVFNKEESNNIIPDFKKDNKGNSHDSVSKDKELTNSKVDKTSSVLNNVKKEESNNIIHYFEKDNKGDRHDSVSKANGYWLGQRLQMADKSQFTLFIFDNPTDAENALLELPFIHKAEDTGNLICDRLFQFGYYKVDGGIYEAIICGFDLTLDEFNNVEKTFLKYNGKRKNSLEPSPLVNKETISVGDVSNVKFIEIYENGDWTYECYEANSKDDAIAFLNTKEVTERLYYIHVKTPKGVIGKDINGTYEI